MKIAANHVEVPPFRKDEYPVGLDEQAIRDQFNRHCCVCGKNFVAAELAFIDTL